MVALYSRPNVCNCRLEREPDRLTKPSKARDAMLELRDLEVGRHAYVAVNISSTRHVRRLLGIATATLVHSATIDTPTRTAPPEIAAIIIQLP